MSTLDLVDVVQDLSTGTYTVSRSAPGSYGTDGRFVPGALSTLTVLASVQPVSGRDLLRLPEGLRTEELIVLYTPTELFTQGAGQDPDLVTVGGVQFQVQRVEFLAELGNYWRVVAMKVGRQAQ